MSTEDTTLEWHKVAEKEELPEGRVTTVTAGVTPVCLTHFGGEYGAISNRCPHQGGPLGEGLIEGGYVRCPWHGYEYHPITGDPPPGFGDAVKPFEVDVRADGIYVGVPIEKEVHTIADEMIETMVEWGVDTVFGMVGHSNLGFADAMRRAEPPLRFTPFCRPSRSRAKRSDVESPSAGSRRGRRDSAARAGSS